VVLGGYRENGWLSLILLGLAGSDGVGWLRGVRRCWGGVAVRCSEVGLSVMRCDGVQCSGVGWSGMQCGGMKLSDVGWWWCGIG
jgi:hypothetical protein